MKPEPYRFNGLNLTNAQTKIDEIADKFSKHKLIEFNGCDASNQERYDFMLKIGSRLNWKVDFDVPGQVQFTYEEDHHLSVEAAQQAEKNNDNDIVVAWHLEHPYGRHPQLGALWYMDKKICPKECGTTGFIDTRVLLQMLDTDDYDFLSQSEIAQMALYFDNENDDIETFSAIETGSNRDFITIKHPNQQTVYPSYLRKPINPHYITGEELLRINPKGHYTKNGYRGHDRLVRFDGRKPTDLEQQRFNSINEWLYSNVQNNEDIAYFKHWDEGDALLVDVYSLIHCVRGGFNIGERYLKGIWGFPNVPDLPREPEQADQTESPRSFWTDQI